MEDRKARMSKIKFMVNQLLDIEVEVKGEEGQVKLESFPSRIEDISKDHIIIAYPFKNGYPVPLHTNETISLRFIQDQTPYACDVKVVTKLTAPVALLKVTKPNKIIRIQKRNWVRLPYNTTVKYKLAGYEVDFMEVMSIDISGGGLLLQTNHAIDINENLDIIFKLDNFTISTTGRVVRSFPADNSYRIAIKFEKISEIERDKIVGFIFQKQREFIKKGIL